MALGEYTSAACNLPVYFQYASACDASGQNFMSLEACDCIQLLYLLQSKACNVVFKHSLILIH